MIPVTDPKSRVCAVFQSQQAQLMKILEESKRVPVEKEVNAQTENELLSDFSLTILMQADDLVVKT